MAIEYGDIVYQYGDTITLPTDGSGSAGDAVTDDGSGLLTPVSATGDKVVGFLSMAPDAETNEAPVHMRAVPVANVAGSVSAYDYLVPDGSNAGRLTTEVGDGTDTGGAAVYAQALCDAGGTFRGRSYGANEAVVVLR